LTLASLQMSEEDTSDICLRSGLISSVSESGRKVKNSSVNPVDSNESRRMREEWARDDLCF
jgi:hypothetical protein